MRISHSPLSSSLFRPTWIVKGSRFRCLSEGRRTKPVAYVTGTRQMDIEKLTEKRARGFLQAGAELSRRRLPPARSRRQTVQGQLLDDEEGAGGRAESARLAATRRAGPAASACRPSMARPAEACRDPGVGTASDPAGTGAACWTPRSKPRPRPATSTSRRTGCWVALAASDTPASPGR